MKVCGRVVPEITYIIAGPKQAKFAKPIGGFAQCVSHIA